MITGSVSATRQASISLRVRGPNRREQEIEAVIDTGFNGLLVLPPTLVQTLALSRLGSVQVTLGDGSRKMLDLYEVTVLWDGQARTIEADVADITPLIGMALLEGYELCIQVMNSGDVSIRAL